MIESMRLITIARSDGVTGTNSVVNSGQPNVVPITPALLRPYSYVIPETPERSTPRSLLLLTMRVLGLQSWGFRFVFKGKEKFQATGKGIVDHGVGNLSDKYKHTYELKDVFTAQTKTTSSIVDIE